MSRTLRYSSAFALVLLGSTSIASAAAMVFTARLTDGRSTAGTSLEATFGETSSPGLWDGTIQIAHRSSDGASASRLARIQFSVNGSTPRLLLSPQSRSEWILHERPSRQGVCYDLVRITSVADQSKSLRRQEQSGQIIQLEGLPVRGIALVNLIDVSFGFGNEGGHRIAAAGAFVDPSIVRALPTWQAAITGAIAGLFWRWRGQRSTASVRAASSIPGTRRRFIGSSPGLRDRTGILVTRRLLHDRPYTSH